MKLAEALNLRADLRIRISQLKGRLCDNAKVQEGELPSEEPEELLKELSNLIKEFEEIVKKINKTNCMTQTPDGSLTELIAKRDAMMLENSIRREFLKEASAKIDRYSNTEIKILSTVDVKIKQQENDLAAKKIRDLDTKIQLYNWTVDLLD